MVKLDFQPEVKYKPISKVGSITLEHDVQGRNLEKELETAQARFIHYIELRGYTLYQAPGFTNPVWITHEKSDELKAYYAIDWEGTRKTGKRVGPDGKPLPRKRETSLEDSEGLVEYRIVGIFWAPETSVEILTDKEKRMIDEKLGRNPKQFGPMILEGVR